MDDGDEEFFYKEHGSCWELGLRLPIEDNPFFKEGKGQTYDEARAYCAGCYVVVDCLLEGIGEDTSGFWGSMSPNERSEVRKQMRRGRPFMQAVESIWQNHRRRGRLPVPPKRVWEEWE